MSAYDTLLVLLMSTAPNAPSVPSIGELARAVVVKHISQRRLK